MKINDFYALAAELGIKRWRQAATLAPAEAERIREWRRVKREQQTRRARPAPPSAPSTHLTHRITAEALRLKRQELLDMQESEALGLPERAALDPLDLDAYGMPAHDNQEGLPDGGSAHSA